MKLSEFLKEYKDILKVRSLEKKAGIPTDTLQKTIQGRELPEKHQEPVKDFLRKLRDSIDSIDIFNF